MQIKLESVLVTYWLKKGIITEPQVEEALAAAKELG